MNRSTILGILFIVVVLGAAAFGFYRYVGLSIFNPKSSQTELKLDKTADPAILPAAVNAELVEIRGNVVAFRIPKITKTAEGTVLNYDNAKAVMTSATRVFRYVADPQSSNGVRIEETNVSQLKPGDKVTIYYDRKNAVTTEGPQILSIHILY